MGLNIDLDDDFEEEEKDEIIPKKTLKKKSKQKKKTTTVTKKSKISKKKKSNTKKKENSKKDQSKTSNNQISQTKVIKFDKIQFEKEITEKIENDFDEKLKLYKLEFENLLMIGQNNFNVQLLNLKENYEKKIAELSLIKESTIDEDIKVILLYWLKTRARCIGTNGTEFITWKKVFQSIYPNKKILDVFKRSNRKDKKWEFIEQNDEEI
jgi:hypothetical protein